MAINTFSIFYYGFKVTNSNKYINFSEGGPELSAEVSIGTYDTLSFAQAVKDALDAAGGQSYTVSFDRTNRRFTISAPGSFNLLADSGTQSLNGTWSLLGYSTTSDFTGTNTYTGDLNGGFAYEPQMRLQSYQAPDTYQELVDVSINEAASGAVEVISFATAKYIELDLNYITNIPQDGHFLKSNPSGVSDAISFLSSIMERGKFEFIPDVSARNTYYTVILGDLDGFKTGTGFKLKELVGKNLPDYYEVTGLKMRIIE